MVSGVSRDAEDRLKAANLPGKRGDVILRHRVRDARAVNIKRGAFPPLVPRDAVIYREPAASPAVQRLNVLPEVLPLLKELPGLLLETGGLRRVAGVKRLLELFEHMAARRLVRVELKAERSYADPPEPLLHHLEGRGLLRDKKDPFVMAERVRDDVGDGLALAGPRRPVHDEAASTVSHGDGAELR